VKLCIQEETFYLCFIVHLKTIQSRPFVSFLTLILYDAANMIRLGLCSHTRSEHPGQTEHGPSDASQLFWTIMLVLLYEEGKTDIEKFDVQAVLNKYLL
jgi:hypothetical protein